MKRMEFKHELIMPNENLPFKVFLFEGGKGNYFRDKHWHRSIEMFAVFEGRLTFLINEEKYPLETGEFMLVNSNEIHSVDSPVSNLTVVIQIPLRAFEQYFTGEQFIRFTHDTKAHDSRLMDLISAIYKDYQEKDYGYELRVQSRYYELLHLLVTKYREEDVTADMLRNHRKLNRLSVITAYVKENYTDELSLERLGQIFGYSPTYLSRMFQKYAGINYKAYLQRIRLEYAYKQICNTEKTLSEIALANGFPNSKAMAKAFAKRYGMLPSEFRRKTAEVLGDKKQT